MRLRTRRAIRSTRCVACVLFGPHSLTVGRPEIQYAPDRIFSQQITLPSSTRIPSRRGDTRRSARTSARLNCVVLPASVKLRRSPETADHLIPAVSITPFPHVGLLFCLKLALLVILKLSIQDQLLDTGRPRTESFVTLDDALPSCFSHRISPCLTAVPGPVPMLHARYTGISLLLLLDRYRCTRYSQVSEPWPCPVAMRHNVRTRGAGRYGRRRPVGLSAEHLVFHYSLRASPTLPDQVEGHLGHHVGLGQHRHTCRQQYLVTRKLHRLERHVSVTNCALRCRRVLLLY